MHDSFEKLLILKPSIYENDKMHAFSNYSVPCSLDLHFLQPNEFPFIRCQKNWNLKKQNYSKKFLNFSVRWAEI